MPRITEADKEARIEATYKLLAKGHRPAQITEAIARKYNCSRLTVRGSYLPRAREMMLEDVRASKADLRSKSLAFYMAVIDEPKASTRDKINAQTRIDKLLGLEVHDKNDGSGEIDKRPVDLTVEIVAELQRRGIAVVHSDGSRGEVERAG